MHGSEIQAKYGSGAWKVCVFDGDSELAVRPPTPCRIGKHPPAPKKEPAGQQGANNGGHKNMYV